VGIALPRIRRRAEAGTFAAVRLFFGPASQQRDQHVAGERHRGLRVDLEACDDPPPGQPRRELGLDPGGRLDVGLQQLKPAFLAILARWNFFRK
jgi:hypothetical protein